MNFLIRSLLVAAALGSFPGHAVELGDADEGGEVLLFPYYLAHADRADSPTTLVTLSSVATDGASEAGPVAMRVAFRAVAPDGRARTPLLIDVLLRSDDAWSFVATRGMLVSVDASCALGPEGPLEALRTGVPLPGPEGWIEVFELGRVTSPEVLARLERSDRAAGCAELAALLPALAADDWLAAPDNRLRGTAHFVSVASGSSVSAPPSVLRHFRDAPIHAPPTQDAPTLADVQPPLAQVRRADGSPRVSTFSDHPVDAVSAVLMATEWVFDFYIAASLGARTDVAITLPTRRWYVAGNRADAPFQHPTREGGAFELNVLPSGREGERGSLAALKCTPPFPVPQLGPVVDTPLKVLRLGGVSAFLHLTAEELTYATHDRTDCAIGGRVPATLTEGGFQAGQLRLQFVDGPRAPTDAVGFGRLISDEGHVYRGIPAIGVAATTVYNLNAQPGLLANYGLLQPIARRVEHGQLFD